MKQRDEKKDIRSFGVGLSIILAVIGSYRLHSMGGDSALWFYIPCGVILILTFLIPSAIRPLYRGMTVIGGKIGWVNERLLLGLVFYFMVTPVAIVFRIMGKDPLERKIDADVGSYWHPRPSSLLDKKRHEQQF